MTIFKFLKSSKFWKRLIRAIFLFPIFLLFLAIGLVSYKQDEIVQHLLKTVNEDFQGKLEVKDSHISLFDNFPYISIDLEKVKIYEDKTNQSAILAELNEVFLGFYLWNVVSGNMKINDIKIKDGTFDLVKHLNGKFNLEIALSGGEKIEDTDKEFHLAIDEIELENVDIHKYNEEDSLLIDALVYTADAKFTITPKHTYIFFDSQFELNLIKGGDTTFIKHKHFDLHTKLDFLTEQEVLKIQPTEIHLESSAFDMKGTIDFKNDMDLDLVFSGNKDNFNLILAMSPEEFIPTLKRYENAGEIYFETSIKGKSINGNTPAINANFGCKNGFFRNKEKNIEVNELNFAATYTNGELRNNSTTKITLQNFSANPAEGKLIANLEVANFDDPEIELKLNASFELDFLKDFFNLNQISDLDGTVDLEMNFHDIVNIENPSHAIEKFNESYSSILKVKDLKFKYGKGDIPLEDLDLLVEVNGHEAFIKHCVLKFGNSDISLNGEISDLPAIIHHTDLVVDTKLALKSKLLDIYELTGSDSNAVDEKVKNLSMNLDFKSTAKAFTESPNLPVGEFFIENLYAELQNYPHSLHDFHADVIIDKENLKVVDFKGMIDESDFHFFGNLKHYDIWFADTSRGDTEVSFDFESSHFGLDDLLAYNGENYVPKEYQHEELLDFKFHGYAKMHYQDSLKAIDLDLTHFRAKMKLHPLKLEDFKGRFHYDNNHFIMHEFVGKMGHSDFNSSLHYYLGDDQKLKIRDNQFFFSSKYLDVDELVNYNIHEEEEQKNHDSIFNIYELPFTDMKFNIDIKKFNYQNYNIGHFYGKAHTTSNHYLYIDTLSMEVAGGIVSTKGFFNGSNPDLIYFSPNMRIHKVDLDKVLLKFDNFGQDHLLSENLHGEFTGRITGEIHMHTDLVPKIDDSEIHIDVHIENGKLENFAMLDSFADYFRDKNLKMVRFDTLDNHMDFTNGVINIPKMTLNSTLGFMEISGQQDADFNFEYNISVPWRMVTSAATSKLFKKKKDEVSPNQIDEIQYAGKRTKYVSIKLKGDSLDYSVSLTRRKKHFD